MEKYLKLGKMLKPQGIKGEIKLSPYTDNLERFLDLPHIFFQVRGEYQKYNVQHARLYKTFAYLKLEGIDTIEQAEPFRGHFLYIDRENAAKLPQGAHYICDLIGLAVEDSEGVLLGQVKDVMNTGAADIYVVRGERNMMFPAAPGVIQKVDVAGGKILVDKKRLEEVAIDDTI